MVPEEDSILISKHLQSHGILAGNMGKAPKRAPEQIVVPPIHCAAGSDTERLAPSRDVCYAPFPIEPLSAAGIRQRPSVHVTLESDVPLFNGSKWWKANI